MNSNGYFTEQKRNKFSNASFTNIMTIGVDLGGTNIRAGIESGGNIFNQRKELLHASGSLSETLTQVIEFIRPLVSADIKGYWYWRAFCCRC